MLPSESNPSVKCIDWLVQEGQYLLPAAAQRRAKQLPNLASWQVAVLEQQRELRHRSRYRFPVPDQWLWTDKCLAQASDWWTACFKASIFPPNTRVVDACCGAGADLVALARRNSVVGIDVDQQVLRLAEANLKAHRQQAELLGRPFAADMVTQSDWLHIDPDRRSIIGGTYRRTRAAEAFSPALSEMLPAARTALGAVLKLAPKTEFTPDALANLESDARRVWIGNRGECRQQIALFGQAIAQFEIRQPDDLPDQTGCWRGAVLAEPDRDPNGSGFNSIQFQGFAEVGPELAATVQDFVYDLHPVLHASQLQTAWAEENGGLQALESNQGYFTSERAIDSPWAQRFDVVEVVAWDDRKIRRTLRGLKAGNVEVKNRLIRLDANHYQRKYSSVSGEPFVLLVTRLDNRIRAIVAKRQRD